MERIFSVFCCRYSWVCYNPKFNPLGPLTLESTFDKIKEEILSTRYSNRGSKFDRDSNRTKDEFTAIKSLRTNNDLIIKPADKGSAIVVMNRTDYIEEGLRQLSNTDFYEETPNDLTDRHVALVTHTIYDLQGKGQISEKTADFLSFNIDRTPQFYMLPKIHKNLEKPPGRPIISGCNGPTEKISKLVDHFLNPLVPSIRSYIKDTDDFLYKLKNIGNLPNNLTLVSLDVSSLYTNIDINEGINACKEMLAIHRSIHELPDNRAIIDLLRLVLENNNFDFADKHYLQKKGVAMGSCVSPSVANIFMSQFERKYVYTHANKPFIWFRYIDDIFAIFTQSDEEIDNFIQHLNNVLPTIKFTFEMSKEQVTFLDTLVYLDNSGNIQTTIYSKETDKHCYLLYDSAHTQHTEDGIPYAQFLRIRRICSTRDHFLKSSIKYAFAFINRRYPITLVFESLMKAMDKDRDTLIRESVFNINNNDDVTQNDSDDNTKFYCVTTYNPKNPPLARVVSKYWPYLEKTPASRWLRNIDIIYGHRRATNLRDYLVKAKCSNRTITDPANRCKRPNDCRYCPIIGRGTHIMNNTTGHRFTTMRNTCCQSSNLIYLIECQVCHIHYVGQTKRPFMRRIYEHLRDIDRGADTTVARHFEVHGPPNAPPCQLLCFTIHKSKSRYRHRDRTQRYS